MSDNISNVAGQHRRWLDISAISLSALCLIHCLATGVFLALVSTLQLSHAWIGQRFHTTIFVVALAVASYALTRGWLQHHLKRALLCGVCGLGLMGSALLPHISHMWETNLTVLGASLLALAHLINMRVHAKSHP